jgi:hypothetical protein
MLGGLYWLNFLCVLIYKGLLTFFAAKVYSYFTLLIDAFYNREKKNHITSTSI